MSKRRQLSNGTAQEVNGVEVPREVNEQKPQPKVTKTKEQLLKYIDSRKDDPPFQVSYENKKRKRSTADDRQAKKIQADSIEHESSFNSRLNCRYKISPTDNWLSMRPYKKFTLTHQNGEGTTTISVGDCVLVVNDPTLDTAKADESDLWKAKVLSVRAIDAEHAYVLVAWLSRPEDVKGGRQPWHGTDELIPTNQLDVIEALSVNGRINVRFTPDTEDADDEGEYDSANVDSTVTYYWRQTFDFANGAGFSSLDKICVDKQPRNPDEVSVKCRNPECGKWMHAHCLARQAIKKARKEAKMSTISDKEIRRDDKVPANADAGATDGHFSAHVYLANDADESIVDSEPHNSEILLLERDKEGITERLSIVCLFCEHPVD